MCRAKGEGLVFDIQRFSLHDGPGIRTSVYLKGCPLRCPWCQNPESWEMAPELMVVESRCLGCGNCRETCPWDVPERVEGQVFFNRRLCRGCGDFHCVPVCSGQALRAAGTWMKPAEVLQEIKKDLPFYQNSGGGATLTGGEPLFQPQFAREILQGCAREGIHTAFETCGLAAEKTFLELLSSTDLVLYDLKIFDPAKHVRLLGCENAAIFQNARTLIHSGKPATFRIPLVPVHTDEEENLRAIGTFLKKEGYRGTVELLPYHRLGENKCRQLGTLPPSHIAEPGREQIEKAQGLLQSLGLGCLIGNE